jgi:hypothetical protein
MKATISWAGALLATALTASFAAADYWPPYYGPAVTGANCYGSGYYAVAPNGVVYGPNYWFRPPGEPFNGSTCDAAPAPSTRGRGRRAPTYPSHPYVRGPRDFFMWRENMEDQMRREQRPVLVP